MNETSSDPADASSSPFVEFVAARRAQSDRHSPQTDDFRVIGEHARATYGFKSLRVLVPGLERSPAFVDDSAISARTRNILARWGKPTWHSLLDVTPMDIIKRSNCGIRSLGEVLALACEAAARPDDPTMPVVKPSRLDGPATPSHAGLPVREALVRVDVLGTEARAGQDAATAFTRAVLEITAWASWEHGKASLADALQLASTPGERPAAILEADATIRATSLRTWTADLAPAYDVVSAVQDTLGSLEANRRVVAERRLLVLDSPATLDELGKDLGITRERVRQIEKATETWLAHAIDKKHRSVRRTATRLRDYLGIASQVEALRSPASPLAALGLTSLDDLATRYLLRLAGPYSLRGDWLILRPARAAVEESKEILRIATASGPAPFARAAEGLIVYGIPAREVAEWIVSVSSFRVEGEFVIPWSGSMADKAWYLLALEGRPMTGDELLERVAPQANGRGLLSQLGSDERLKRTGVHHWGLRQWAHDEYTTVADEIAQEIQRQGGSAQMEHLVEYVSSTYGVAQGSVRSYASGPRFARDGRGNVSLATTTPNWAPPRPPQESKGLYLHGDRWALRLRINPDMMRGSGFPVSTAFAGLIGIRPLESRLLETPRGPLLASWTNLQPTLGSIRSQLEALGASVGDTCFIAAREGSAEIFVTRQDDIATLTGIERTAAEMGLDPSGGLDAIGVAIGLEGGASSAAITRRLQARGEADLAAHLQDPDEDEDALVLSLDSAKFVEVKWGH